MSKEIENGDTYCHRRHDYKIARVQFLTADNGVCYRIKGARRLYLSTQRNFLRNWTGPINREPTEASQLKGE